MAIQIGIKHIIYAFLLAVVGGLIGAVAGEVIYIYLLGASAFVSTSSAVYGAIISAVSSASIYPLVLGLIGTAVGFFSGLYITIKEDENKA